MPQAATLSRIGAQVKVELDLVKDRIPTNLIQSLSKNPRGKVIDYKMTDGGEIGVVLELSDGKASWFFGNEVVRA